jgi:hypothetical protein
MNNKYEDPPAYSQAGQQQQYPQYPQEAYHGYSQGPPAGGYYGGQQMHYGQPQGPYPPQQGYGPGPYGPGPYQQQPYGYYDDRRGGPGMCEGLLAAMACCCCLDCLLF